MLSVKNNTMFSVGSGVLFDLDGSDLAVVAVKAVFELPENGCTAKPSSEHMAVLACDEYEDDSETACIRYPADLVPGKKGTDIGLSGTVYSPGSEYVKKLKASVRAAHCYKEIIATGDRFWTENLLGSGYSITEPELFDHLPIVTDRISGGKSSVLSVDKVMGVKLSNFEDPKNRIRTFGKDHMPVSFGFLCPGSPHRLQFAGTYDESWMISRRPLYPEDLDLRFFNFAQPELISDGFLQGGETVRLTNLTPDGLREFQIPRFDLKMTFVIKGSQIQKKALLHTVMIEPDLNRFYMTWWAAERTGISPRNLDRVEVDILKTPVTDF